MKHLIMVLLFGSQLTVFGFDSLLLKSQLDLYPKILLLDKKIDGKTINGIIAFLIVYHKKDRNAAEEVRKEMISIHGGNIGGYLLDIKTMDVESIKSKVNATAVFLLCDAHDHWGEALMQNISDSVIFAHDKRNLAEGAMITLSLGKKMAIYMNSGLARRKDVDFDSALYSLVRFVGK